MNARAQQEFGWQLREAGIDLPFVTFHDLCRVVAQFTSSEYERGYDEGCHEMDDPSDDFTHGPV